MKSREPIVHNSVKYGANIYTYADSISRVMEKNKLSSAKKPLFKGVRTMGNTKGRDNKMYYVSDGFNLDESQGNQFVSLLTLNGVISNRSQLSSTIQIPSIRSQAI